MTKTFWFHFDISNAIGHILSVSDNLPQNPAANDLVSGFRYSDVGMYPQDFIGDVLDMTSSDGDSVIMAAEIQGNDHVWERIDEQQFKAIAERGALMGSTRTSFSGYRIEDGRAFAATGHDFEPEISESLSP